MPAGKPGPAAPGGPPPRAGGAGIGIGIGEHTLRIEAARAGVSVQEYLTRLRQGTLYCYRCRDWHDAGDFPADARRHSGRAGSCQASIRAEIRASLTSRIQAPPPAQVPPPAATWVISRTEPSPAGRPAVSYWRGPGTARDRAWSPALDDGTARFPSRAQAHDALTAAFGGAGAVPLGCRLTRLA